MAQSLLHDALRERFAKIIRKHKQIDEEKRRYGRASDILGIELADKLIDEMNRMAPDTASEAA